MSVYARRGELDFTAAVFTGILCSFLILDLEVHDLFDHRPPDAARNAAAVHEQGRRGRHAKVPRFGDGLFHFRRGLAIVDAAVELQRVDFLALGEVQNFRFEVLRSDLGLVLEDPVVILPEGRRVLNPPPGC